MEVNHLAEWNPWWNDKSAIRRYSGISRPQYKKLIDSYKAKEITAITGVRRSGKSTMMYQMIQQLIEEGTNPDNILFINLEDKRLKDNTLEEIYDLYRNELNTSEKAYIFLDEVHAKEGWESFLRTKYDQKTDDKFVVSGSSSYLLKKEYSSLLTGRNLSFEVYPLSFSEFLSFHNIHPKKTPKAKILNSLKDYLRNGGFPESVLRKDFRKEIMSQYFDDILFHDIIDRHNLSSQKVKDLAMMLLSGITGQVSLRKIRSMTGLSYDTIKDYLEYYKQSFLIFTLNHFSYSYRTQKTLPSKAYAIDNGLRNSVAFSFSEDIGKLAENLVFIKLKSEGSNIYYWNDSHEVDFLIKEADQSLTAINVTFTDDINPRETKGLIEFQKKYKQAKKLILITKDTEGKKNNIQMIPLWKWLLKQSYTQT